MTRPNDELCAWSGPSYFAGSKETVWELIYNVTERVEVTLCEGKLVRLDDVSNGLPPHAIAAIAKKCEEWVEEGNLKWELNTLAGDYKHYLKRMNHGVWDPLGFWSYPSTPGLGWVWSTRKGVCIRDNEITEIFKKLEKLELYCMGSVQGSKKSSQYETEELPLRTLDTWDWVDIGHEISPGGSKKRVWTLRDDVSKYCNELRAELRTKTEALNRLQTTNKNI